MPIRNSRSSGGSSSSSDFEIKVVENYSALPDPTIVAEKFYFCKNSQGTKWLPFSLGGTFFDAGTYYSDGSVWIHGILPYQANQTDVDAGVITDEFVSPKTLKDYSGWIFSFAAKPDNGKDGIIIGAVDGANKIYYTPEGNYKAGTLEIFVDGLHNRDFAETTPLTGKFTLGFSPLTDSVIEIKYKLQ